MATLYVGGRMFDGEKVVDGQAVLEEGGRIKKIADRVKTMVVALPFEKAIYDRAGLDCRYFGHPLVEIARPESDRRQARDNLGAVEGQRVVALFPGSRSSEIKHILPHMLEAAKILAGRFADLRFYLALAPTVEKSRIEREIAKSGAKVTIISGANYDLLSASDFAIMASGTAALEAALLGVPMIIVYRGTALNVALAKRLVKVDFFGLPNLVANRKIVPELLQAEAEGGKVAELAGELLSDPKRLAEMREELAKVRGILVKTENVSRSVAALALEMAGAPSSGADFGKSGRLDG